MPHLKRTRRLTLHGHFSTFHVFGAKAPDVTSCQFDDVVVTSPKPVSKVWSERSPEKKREIYNNRDDGRKFSSV